MIFYPRLQMPTGTSALPALLVYVEIESFEVESFELESDGACPNSGKAILNEFNVRNNPLQSYKPSALKS